MDGIIYKPLVSIIMSVFNVPSKEILKLSIDSILNQSYKDYEFIICDDGSTNDTYEWINDIISKDDRVKVLKNQTNKGLAYSLNYCISVAKGELLVRQDADDYSNIKRIQTIVEFYNKNKEYDIISSNIVLFNQDGTWGKMQYPKEPCAKDFLFCVPFMHGAVAMKKHAVLKSGGYRVAKETRRAEDIDLFMRMYALGSKGYTIQENLYFFREDINACKRREYKYRIDEVKVKYKGFKLLNLMPIGTIYAIKPLIVGIIPINILNKIKNSYYKRIDK